MADSAGAGTQAAPFQVDTQAGSSGPGPGPGPGAGGEPPAWSLWHGPSLTDTGSLAATARTERRGMMQIQSRLQVRVT